MWPRRRARHVLHGLGSGLSVGAPAATRARVVWAMGDTDGAIALYEADCPGAGAHAVRYRIGLEPLEEGLGLAAPQLAEEVPARAVPDGRFRVLHLPPDSLPRTRSGYALRRPGILAALARHGFEALALTRTGFPVMVGKTQSAQEDVIDGIRYQRTLPPRLWTITSGSCGATPLHLDVLPASADHEECPEPSGAASGWC